uniref:Pyridoxal phosphate homeostasis protein n=1 Tax=Chlorobium chlorochromatii (strain CaD3) TaxID=340177 RepID=Q3AQW5_CHLCH
MESIASNLAAIHAQVAAACKQAGRKPESVRLIAVSKTKSAELVREAFDAGQLEFGESYMQEFLEKYESRALQGCPIQWHFIGHLQSNKVRSLVGKVSLIHGIDKLSTAEELSKRAVQQNLTVDYLLEVNTSGEASKYGMAPHTVLSEASAFFALPNVRLRGLMTIATYEREAARREFQELRELLEQLQAIAPDPTLVTELSMGMSGDFEEAIQEGATMIRVGSAIFGWR